MRFKLYIGKLINQIIIKTYNFNFKLLGFIPNGRYLNLDLQRAGLTIDNIFDVGANIGQTALGFAQAFPYSTIFSFEPVLQTFEILKKNTSKFSKIKTNNIALGQYKQVLSIINHEDSEINSLKRTTSFENEKSTSIQVLTGQSFCEENNIRKIDILKIDVEGFEMEVLMGFDELFLKNNVKCIYAEVGFDQNDELKTMFSDINTYLSKLDFVTSGFYEPYRWGSTKLRLGFCNALFINTNLIQN
ncbi:MAG: FkbM family methyltransferase [Pedobacter sp.]|nr:MAG: FkbM family methyltransferase [Pedobacter sp.]